MPVIPFALSSRAGVADDDGIHQQGSHKSLLFSTTHLGA